MERTLHGWTQDFWQRMPLPIAELGVQLSISEPDYLRKLFALTEATFGLGVAYGLAYARAFDPDWPTLARQVTPLLSRSSLGHRHQVLTLLDKRLRGASGWNLAERAPLLAGIVQAMLSQQATDRPTVTQGMSALVRARNAYAHPSTGTTPSSELLVTWEQALQALLSSNSLFSESRLLWLETVRISTGGGYELTAQSLQGPVAMPYRRGTTQPVTDPVQPGKVYLRFPDERLLKLHPFVAASTGRTYVLADIGRAPSLWNPLSGDTYPDDLSRDFEDAFAAGTVDAEAPPTAEHVPDTVADYPAAAQHRSASAFQAPAPIGDDDQASAEVPATRWLPATHLWMIAAGLATVLLVSGAVGVALLLAPDEETVTVSGDPQVAPSGVGSSPLGSGSLEPDDPSCDVSPSSAPTAADLPAFLTGMALHWGEPPSDVVARCGPMDTASGEACTAEILEWRRTTRTGPHVPEGDVALPFHHRHGLFEVLLYTDEPVDVVVDQLERYTENARRVDDDPVHWDFGDASLSVDVARRDGRTLIKAWHDENDRAYHAERCEVCPCRNR